MKFSNCLFLLGLAATALVPLVSRAQTCNAGSPDTAFGPATSGGYVQAGPILGQGGGSGEGLAVGADKSIYAASIVGYDTTGVGDQVDIAKFRPGGALDTTYGGFGLVSPPGVGGVDQVAIDAAGNLIVVQSDNKTSMSISRYSAAGVIDTGFGSSGLATFSFTNPFVVMGVASGADGSIFVASAAKTAGYSQQPFVLKLTPAGLADSSFGSGGVSFVPLPATLTWARATDVAVLASGQIVVAGRGMVSPTRRQFLVTRLQGDGSLDTSFGTNGMTLVDFGDVQAQGRRMAIQPDGKIVVAGNITDTTVTPNAFTIGLIRLLANGQPDTSFAAGGQTSFSYGFGTGGYGVAMQNNGKILVGSFVYLDAAQTQSAASVVRFTATGAPDVAFGSGGVAQFIPPTWVYASGDEISYDAGGKIILKILASNGTGSAIAVYLVRIDSGTGKNCH